MIPTDYQAARERAAFFDLEFPAVIEAAGPDARDFLHNLCTQDVKTLPVGESREAFLTTNKARVIAHVWITLREPECYWVTTIANQMPDLAGKIFAHLNRFLISERVELTDRSHDHGLLQVVGPNAAALEKELGLLPLRRHRLLGLDAFDLGWRGAASVANEYGELTQKLTAASAIHGGPLAYQMLRIEAGLPTYGIDIDENRLAMEVNRPSAISYNKGCYLGQETIVMARDRGQVNRLMLGLKLAQDTIIPHGAKVHRGAEEVGQITSSVFSPRLGRVIALAYLRRGCWDAGTEVVVDPDRAAVVCALPF